MQSTGVDGPWQAMTVACTVLQEHGARITVGGLVGVSAL